MLVHMLEQLQRAWRVCWRPASNVAGMIQVQLVLCIRCQASCTALASHTRLCAACRDYKSIEELAADYKSGDLHPKDLKDGLAAALNQILDPVRRHFETDATAKALLKKVRTFQATR